MLTINQNTNRSTQAQCKYVCLYAFGIETVTQTYAKMNNHKEKNGFKFLIMLLETNGLVFVERDELTTSHSLLNKDVKKKERNETR